MVHTVHRTRGTSVGKNRSNSFASRTFVFLLLFSLLRFFASFFCVRLVEGLVQLGEEFVELAARQGRREVVEVVVDVAEVVRVVAVVVGDRRFLLLHLGGCGA